MYYIYILLKFCICAYFSFKITAYLVTIAYLFTTAYLFTIAYLYTTAYLFTTVRSVHILQITIFIDNYNHILLINILIKYIFVYVLFYFLLF